MTRAFVALQPPPPVLDVIAAATSGVEIHELRRTTREQWHITVQFLGNVEDLDAIARALDGVEAEPARVRIGGAGAFPSTRRASVLWLGISDGRDWLVDVAADVATRLEPLGFARARSVRTIRTSPWRGRAGVRSTCARLSTRSIATRTARRGRRAS
jgi:2'-5' RNA ligase